jgi:excisionase family DNA binding protein
MERAIRLQLEKIEGLLVQLLAGAEKPLDLAEAAAYLRQSKSHLYHLTSAGHIPYYKPNGKKIYFKKADLDAYLLRNRHAGTAELEELASAYSLPPGIESRTKRRQSRGAGTGPGAASARCDSSYDRTGDDPHGR